MRQPFEDHDDPASSTRRRAFSTTRAQKIRNEGELIAHVGRGEGTHADDLKLDLTAFLVGSDDKVPYGDRLYCVFYNNHLSPDRSVRFLEDEHDGSEFVQVHLKSVDDQVRKIIFAVTIYDADALGHTFGSVNDARFWIEGEFLNRAGMAPIHNDELSKLYPTSAGVVIGEVYRSGKGWEYRTLGANHTYPGLNEIGATYGVQFDP